MMFKRPALAALAAAALLSMNAQAVDLILDTSSGDCTFPLQSNSSVSISPTTGNVLAVLSSTYNPGASGCAALGEPAQAPSFTAPLRVNGASSFTFGSAAAGQVGLTWTSVNAAYCTSSGSVLPTTVTNWPAAGTVMPIARTAGSPLSVTVPANTTTSQRIYTFGLRCVGIVAPDTSNSTVQVTVPGDTGGGGNPPPTGCEGATWPQGYSKVNTAVIKFNSGVTHSVNANLFAEVFRSTTAASVPWPGNTSTRGIRIPSTGFVASQFTVPIDAPATFWRLDQEDHLDTSAPRRPATVTVSECPGHFNLTGENAVDGRCVRYPETVQGQFFTQLVADSATHTGSLCPIQRGKTYYLNFIHHDPRDGSSTCDNSQCSWFGKSQAN